MSIYEKVLIFRLCHYAYFCFECLCETCLKSVIIVVFSTWMKKKEEILVDRSDSVGLEFRKQLSKLQQKFPQIIRQVRGRGLLNAVELNSRALSSVSAYDICLKLKERGILAKPTHNTIIRLAPPLSVR